MSDVPAVAVLWSDPHALVVDKPSGLHVHRTPLGDDQLVLMDLVTEALGERAWPVHRLDRPSSGAVLFARHREEVAAFQAALAAAGSRKLYLALVRRPVTEAGLIDRPLKHLDTGTPREARTRYRPLEALGRSTLLEVEIETGRRHQIRRHLDRIAAQILGDSRYGKSRINAVVRERYGLERLFLHATRLELDHPFGGPRIVADSPLPAELVAVLERMRRDPS